MLGRGLITKAESSTLDVEFTNFFLHLLKGMLDFDDALFTFFQCGGDLQLIKSGDTSYSQFLEICLQDLFDQSKEFINNALKINPFSLMPLATACQMIMESLQKKKAKK